MPRADDTRGALPPLLSALNARETNLVLDLQSFSTRKLDDFYRRHDMGSPGVNGISRQFVAASRKLATTLNTRSLEHVNVAAIVIDGTEYHGHTIYWALGVDVDGRKVPLGFVEGPTENAELVSGLLRNLHEERRLDSRDALWVVDAHRASEKALKELPWEPAVQRCTFHKGTRLVQHHLPAEQREQLGEEVYRRLGRAWAQNDPRKALKRLERIADWLRRAGHERAAKSLLTDVEMSLKLQQLGIADQQLRRSLRSTNAIESAHSIFSDYRGKPDHWTGDMRERFFAAGLACAERAWGRIGTSYALERLQLAIALSRHPDVRLTLARRRRTLTVGDVRVRGGAEGADPERAQAALGDVLRWADRNGRPLALADDAFARLGESGAQELRRWSAEQGFAPGRHAALVRPAQRAPVRAAEHARNAVDAGADHPAPASEGSPARADRRRTTAPAEPVRAAAAAAAPELRAGVDATGLELAPSMVERSDAELEALAGQRDAALAQLAHVEGDVAAWWRDRALGGARAVALARAAMARGERPWRNPLDGARRRVLGEARTQWLLGESAYQGALIDDAPDERLAALREHVGDPLAGLDGAIARVEDAAAATAAAQELERRRQFAAARARAAEAKDAESPSHAAAAGSDAATAEPTASAIRAESAVPAPGGARPARDARPLAPLDRYASALGPRRTALLRARADALAPELKQLDARTLEELREAVGDPWRRLDAASARRTRALEERDREGALRERARALRELVGWERTAEHGRNRHVRQAAAERAQLAREEARGLWRRLQEIERAAADEREREGSLDRFLAERPDAALHHAVEVERASRQERVVDQAQAAATAALEQPAREQEPGAAGIDAGM